MPLHTLIADTDLRYGVWHNEEGDRFFLDNLSLYEQEHQEVSKLKTRKKSEWLCSRFLLDKVTGHRINGACLKDTFGKPYIDGSRDFISISHTFDFTAVIVSHKVCGIDLQVMVSKIIYIGPRFISKLEMSFIPENNKLPYYHVIWGAKEAMYKCFGKKELDFKAHLMVDEFSYEKNGFCFSGSLKKGELFKKYRLYCKQIDQMILVYAIED